jgi:hypothetical protein
MANKEQLKWLLHSLENWNEWRKENSEIKVRERLKRVTGSVVRLRQSS